MRVNIEDKVWTDLRFLKLARRLKLPVGAAIGLMAAAWRVLQENRVDFMREDELDAVVGITGFCECSALSGLVERIDDETVRVLGMKERIEQIEQYIENKRKSGRAGGLKRGENMKHPLSSRQANAQAPAKQPSSECSSERLGEGIAKSKQNVASMSMSMSMSAYEIQESAPADSPLPSANASGMLSSDELSNAMQDVLEAEILPALPSLSKRKHVSKKAAQIDDEQYAFGETWLTWAKVGTPTLDGTAQKYGEYIAEIMRRVKTDAGTLSLEGLKAIFEWATNDEFWAKQILSPGGMLRKNKSGVRKIDTIINQMNRQDNKGRINSQFMRDLDNGKEPVDDGSLDWIGSHRS